ncbi:MAG: energy transducer TonB [Bacteroidetes bacterium]|nr:energy transducer TonB [Bacteroidota bacterium]
MKRIITLIGILLLTQASFSQDKKNDPGQNRDQNSSKNSKTSQYPGGDDSMKCYLVKNLDPKIVSGKSLPRGSVQVTFTIEPDGKTSNITIVKSHSKEVDEEIVRVISEMPVWTPAEQLVGYPKGKWVKVPSTFELSFTIPYSDQCPGKKQK